jgi:hypothetical protein
LRQSAIFPLDGFMTGSPDRDRLLRDRRPVLWTGLGTGFERFVKSGGFSRQPGGLAEMPDKSRPRPISLQTILLQRS